jgi:SAM-dependent methyltransferase
LFLRNALLRLRAQKRRLRRFGEAKALSANWPAPERRRVPGGAAPKSGLERLFDARTQGRGVWKWRHYFEPYERHLAKFVGKAPRILEIGVYSGGSLQMWLDYFGPGTQVIGVDILPECRAYAGEDVSILIGDQADAGFWARVRAAEEPFDVVIDDGGHTAQQQITTARELLTHVAPGGVYVCEDVHGHYAEFAAFASGLADSLNAFSAEVNDDPERSLAARVTAFQGAVRSVCHYPFITFIEMHAHPVDELVCPKHGSEWHPTR